MALSKVGVIGLGNMGAGIAASLKRGGFEVSGFDASQARRPLLEAEGIRFMDDRLALLHEVDTIICSLPYAKDVETVLTAEGGLLSLQDKSVLVIDTSTSDPTTSRRLAETLAAAGHGFLDAPVSGGPAGAATGSLTMMIGGSAADVARAEPILAAMATSRIHVGPSGAGNIAKLVNNLLVASHLITNREAMRLSAAAGLAPEDVLKVINAATGRSAISEVMYPRWVLPGGFNSGFSAGLMRKDLRLAIELATANGIVLPLSTQVRQLWQVTDGLADADDFTRMADYRDQEEVV